MGSLCGIYSGLCCNESPPIISNSIISATSVDDASAMLPSLIYCRDVILVSVGLPFNGCSTCSGSSRAARGETELFRNEASPDEPNSKH